MEAFEEFFLEKIDQGAQLNGETLARQDWDILKTQLPVDPLLPKSTPKEEMDKVREQAQAVLQRTFEGVDQARWSARMVAALRRAYEQDLESWHNLKNHSPHLLEGKTPPPLRWESQVKELYHQSNLILSGIVQGWYFTFFRKQTQQYTFWGQLIRSLNRFTLFGRRL